MKKLFTKSAVALALLVGVFFVLGVTTDVLAVLSNNVRVALDGGGSGGGYTFPRARIPEITPTQQGTELQVTDAFTGTVSAEESYNVQINSTFWYAWNRFMSPSNTDTAIQGYVTALSQPNITIGYKVGVLDADTNQPIERNATVSVGDRIKLVFGPYLSDDIFWFGTGYSMDSPYGEWRANAAAPARVGGKVTCDAKDFTVKYNLTDYGLTFDVYIPFVVNPSARSFVNLPSNLDCDAVVGNGTGELSRTCTVTGTGNINPKFRFDATYGKFYYRYKDFRSGMSGCFGNNIPLTTKFGNAGGPQYNTVTTIDPGTQVNIPAREIAYPLKVAQGSNPPGAPTMVCPSSSVEVNQNVTVTIQATDPDGDQVRYGLDWNNDATKSVNSGWSPLVTSGTPRSFVKAGGYATTGTKTVYGIAEDASGAQSTWGSCTVTVQDAPECSDNQDNDSDGLNNYGADPGCTSVNDDSENPNPGPPPTARLDVTPSTITRGSSAILTWRSTNATTCTGSGFSTGNAANNNTGVSTGPVMSDRSYQVTCTGSGGSASDTATLTVIDPGATITATPDRVEAGDESALTWTTTDATACTVTGTNGFASSQLSGTAVPSGKISGQTTFTISCDGGLATDSVIVNVVPKIEEF